MPSSPDPNLSSPIPTAVQSAATPPGSPPSSEDASLRRDGRWSAETSNWTVQVVLSGYRFEGTAYCRATNQRYRMSDSIDEQENVDGTGLPVRLAYQYGTIDISGIGPPWSFPPGLLAPKPPSRCSTLERFLIYRSGSDIALSVASKRYIMSTILHSMTLL